MRGSGRGKRGTGVLGTLVSLRLSLSGETRDGTDKSDASRGPTNHDETKGDHRFRPSSPSFAPDPRSGSGYPTILLLGRRRSDNSHSQAPLSTVNFVSCVKRMSLNGCTGLNGCSTATDRVWYYRQRTWGRSPSLVRDDSLGKRTPSGEKCPRTRRGRV